MAGERVFETLLSVENISQHRVVKLENKNCECMRSDVAHSSLVTCVLDLTSPRLLLCCCTFDLGNQIAEVNALDLCFNAVLDLSVLLILILFVLCLTEQRMKCLVSL